jgi:hypothetical protein
MAFDPNTYLSQTAPNGGGFDPDQYLKQTAPQIGGLESFSRGAANNFPLAPQAIAGGEALLGDKGYSENLSDWNAKAQAAKAANPVTYGAGAVAGAAAPLLIPGVGEALEAAPITGNALYGAANAISNTDLAKNPKGALKQAVIGGGIGAGTAGLVGALTPGEGTLENIASKKAVQSVELPPGIVGAMSPAEREEMADFIQGNNLVGSNKSDILEQARKLSKGFGDKIGEIGDKAGAEALQIDPAEHYSAMTGLLDKGGKYEGLANREARSLARDYKAGANDILNLPAKPSWEDIQALKEQYGKLAFDSKGEIKSEGAKDTYFALKDMLKSIASKAQDNPNLGNEYKQALAGYSRMQPIESGLEKAVDADLRGSGTGIGARGLAGLVRKLPGPVRAVAGPAAVAMGHPVIGLAAALPEMMNPALQSKAASMAAPYAARTGQGVNQELIDFLSSKYANKNKGAIPQ